MYESFLINMNNIWIYAISCVCSDDMTDVLCGKAFTLDTICMLFNQFFHACHLIGAIDFYHFMPLNSDLDLGWKVSTNQNLLALFSPTLLN